MKKLLIFGIAHLITNTIIAQKIDTTEIKYFSNLTQLTFDADNSKANISSDGQKLVYQSNNPAFTKGCDQIFFKEINDVNGIPVMISNGQGKAISSCFFDDFIIYASSYEAAKECPVAQKTGSKVLWELFANYEIYKTDKSGNETMNISKNKNFYDAEIAVIPNGQKLVFTSNRSGDMELWTMNLDGTDQKQITKTLGYEGGASFSNDGKMLVFRAYFPKSNEEKVTYKKQIAKNLVSPEKMEIYTCNIDGSNLKQITRLGKTNLSPCFHPDGKRIFFSSNYASKTGKEFQLYCINYDGTELKQITTTGTFNAYPTFNIDGTKLVFSSNRQDEKNNTGINLFIADWDN